MSYAGQQTRVAWYDRAPLVRMLAYNAIVAPHALTQRWAYTVPASRKFQIQIGQFSIKNMTAAGGPIGQQTAQLDYLPSGGAQGSIVMSQLFSISTGDAIFQAVGTTAAILTGDQLFGYTSNLNGGGGTSDMLATIQGLEFDL
jgi:hypothetical protein